MKKKIILFLLSAYILLLTSFSFGQGTIRGKISDENGEALIGVIIVLKENPSIGNTSDLDGNFSFKITSTTQQTLKVSYLGYYPQEEIIHPLNNEVIIKNFTLVQIHNIMNEVEVSARIIRSNDNYMEKIKSKSAVSLDYISASIIKKTGDVNVTSAIARVPGVSTNGAFITVRGIGDRYIKTTINDLRIPTLDPFTNNIKLDMIPASLVDNIIITKTASPDLPGDWAGAYLSIETKDYPDRLSVNVETSVGYNEQSSFKDVLTSKKSSTDWLGYDNGFRDHDNSKFVFANTNPSVYQEFVALGLGDYYKSIGVTSTTPWNETYYKLGLVQLGLLAPGLINNEDAVKNAKTEYDLGPYHTNAFESINANAAKSGQSFPNNWNTFYKKAPLNFSQSFSVGNQNTLFGRPLGYIFGFRYGSSVQYDPASKANRLRSDGNYESQSDQQSSKEINGWSALMNLAYKYNSNNSVSLLFMPNLTGVNNILTSIDPSQFNLGQVQITKSQFYEERRQLVYQLKSEHYIPGQKIKVEFNASYTNGKSSAPDFKNLAYWKDTIAHTYQIGGSIGDGIHRYYRYLTDNLFDSKLSAEMPLDNKSGLLRKIKIGGGYQKNFKENQQYDYNLLFGSYSNPMLNEDLDSYFSLDKFGIHNYTDKNGNHNTLDYYYWRNSSDIDKTFGRSEIIAGFAMLDYTIVPALRISGGFRVEKANIFTDVSKYDSLHYATDDERRTYRTGFPLANPGKLNEFDFLPSANIIFKINNNETAPVNLRFNYSQTIARPSIRELSEVALYDFELRSFVFGNSSLKTVHVSNYDLRLESYFKNGDNISISFFDKNFKNHIELVHSNGYSWQNVDKSSAMGIEIEGKKNILKNIEFRGNITIVKSFTKYIRQQLEIEQGHKKYIPIDTVNRSMYGQSPFVINSIVTYNMDSLGLSLTLTYNLQGPRLVIVSDIKEIPDVYELSRNLLDFKVSKTLGKHFSVSFKIRDLLNAPIRRTYKTADGFKIDYDRFRYGTNYVFSILYKI